MGNEGNETGFVKDRNRQGRTAIATNPNKRLNVLHSFIEDPRKSVRKVAQQHDINPMSVHKIPKKEKFHPYKIHLAQKLCEDEFDRRIEFCESMMLNIDRNLLFVDDIIFSDEATFELIGNVNRHNCRYWSDENPHWMYEAHTQIQQKVNVWAGILNEAIIGPFFIEARWGATSLRFTSTPISK
ncbi:PREDICTED: uncharacterized protein LOC108767664 [Trachymyrmex cornetzi]|uniref:uncharacterized protein LOC108767664 n=1 Tax=Trachymyrmex cornetzi TaxID=471704 RepID=UPI00084ED6F9|nr:PREDICTED: uncharacterized protein LOC108767664 [Trachymyrmex cornetzi]